MLRPEAALRIDLAVVGPITRQAGLGIAEKLEAGQ